MKNLDALKIWHGISEALIKEDFIDRDLSNRQLFVLLEIYLNDGPHTISSLKRKMNGNKAAVFRALNTLIGKELLKRCPDPRDKRSVVFIQTAAGVLFIKSLADLICSKITEGVDCT